MRHVIRLSAAATALLITLGRVSSSLAGDASLSFVSDETWTASSMLADGSMGALLGNGECVCVALGGCPCCWTTNNSAIPGACWVWKPGTNSATVPVDLQGMFLEKVLDIPGIPDAATLYQG